MSGEAPNRRPNAVCPECGGENLSAGYGSCDVCEDTGVVVFDGPVHPDYQLEPVQIALHDLDKEKPRSRVSRGE